MSMPFLHGDAVLCASAIGICFGHLQLAYGEVTSDGPAMASIFLAFSLPFSLTLCLFFIFFSIFFPNFFF